MTGQPRSGRPPVPGHPFQPDLSGHSQDPLSGPLENPREDDAAKKDSRALGEWVNTTQGIVTIIATLITLIFGGGGIALALRRDTPPNPAPATVNASLAPSPTDSKPGPTAGQVKKALLTSSNLAIIDKNLTSFDVQPTDLPATCPRGSDDAVIDRNRQFADKAAGVNIFNEITLYGSSGDARKAVAETKKDYSCALTGRLYSSSSISSRLDGLGDQRYAWKLVAKDQGYVWSFYYGIVRYGRTTVAFDLTVPHESPFDYSPYFVTGMEIAVQKVEEIP